jgi:hypothetical protein
MAIINRNKSYVFNMTIPTEITQLSSFPCSEVTLSNHTAGNIFIYPHLGLYTTDRRFLLSARQSQTFRGITNTDELSALAVSAGNVYAITVYYSGSMLTQ